MVATRAWWWRRCSVELVEQGRGEEVEKEERLGSSAAFVGQEGGGTPAKEGARRSGAGRPWWP